MGLEKDVAIIAKITFDADDAGPELLERQVALVRSELLRLDVENVRRPSTTAPSGTRGGDLAVAGALLVEILPVLPHLQAVVDLLRGWAKRSRGKVSLTIRDESIVLDGATDAQADRLIDLFLERHSQPGHD